MESTFTIDTHRKSPIKEYLKNFKMLKTAKKSYDGIYLADRLFNPKKSVLPLEKFVQYYFGSKALDPATLRQRRIIALTDVVYYNLSMFFKDSKSFHPTDALEEKISACEYKNAKKYYTLYHR